MTLSLLLLTDEWGQHHSLIPLIAQLQPLFSTVAVLDPYHGQRFAFANKAEAQHHFATRSHIGEYQQQIEAWFEQAPKHPYCALAFGAGADALWPLLAQRPGQVLTKAALVYGAQIPHHSEITPLCPAQLWLCHQESEVKARQTALNQYADIMLTEQVAGYFNPRSEHYDPVAATQDLNILIRYLQRT
ncbi:MAG: hypothetical protein R3Y10_03585 [Ferrimonas sp.]